MRTCDHAALVAIISALQRSSRKVTFPDVPNGLHFRKLQLLCCRWEDLRYITELVTACSGTLEFLGLTCLAKGAIPFC